MKTLVPFAILAISLKAYPCSYPVDLLENQDGSPIFEIQFNQKPNPRFSIIFESAETILSPEKSGWLLIDQTTQKNLIPLHSKFTSHNKTKTLSTNDLKSVNDLVASLKSSILVFNMGGSVRYVKVNQLCKLYPEKILNLDNYEKGCP